MYNTKKRIPALLIAFVLLASLLAACGQGKVLPKDIPALLATRDRRDVPSVTAPPQGLALVNVVYPESQ